MNFNFAELGDNVFTFNQVHISANSLFNILFVLRLLELVNNVVSSAYTMNLNNLFQNNYIYCLNK